VISPGIPKILVFIDTNPAGSRTGKNTTFDVPPPGVGVTTVTEPVLAAAISVLRIVAVNCEAFTNVVARGLPFQFTVDPETKPVPFTVRVNVGPAGATLAGING
jgi:hypothetical protein